ncbi:MAG: HNH endonuclease [Geminicoccaceae bacterium]|nr:MAG: HNH endonuclease [Geminicoccaceae bacterium]
MMRGRKRPEINTIREAIAWTYANLARAHMALEEGATKYDQRHHIVRDRTYRGLVEGTIAMRSLIDDERMKMKLPQCCAYCGANGTLTIDHLLPRVGGGIDAASNAVWACRSCNSSKGKKDVTAWLVARSRFPSVVVLRRYLKLVYQWCDGEGILDVAKDQLKADNLPFSADMLPLSFPPLPELCFTVEPVEHSNDAARSEMRKDVGS